jgi:hypothetical protein
MEAPFITTMAIETPACWNTHTTASCGMGTAGTGPSQFKLPHFIQIMRTISPYEDREMADKISDSIQNKYPGRMDEVREDVRTELDKDDLAFIDSSRTQQRARLADQAGSQDRQLLGYVDAHGTGMT